MLYFVSRVLSSKNFPRAKDAKKNDGITTSRKIFFFPYLALTATLNRDLEDRRRTDKPPYLGTSAEIY